MTDEITSNPFAALFNSLEEVQNLKDTTKSDHDVNLSTERELNLCLTRKLEEVLVITLDKEITSNCSVLLEDITFRKTTHDVLDSELVNQCLFERLMLDELASNVVCKCKGKGKHSADVAERRPLFYLYQCYFRSETVLSNKDEIKSVKDAVTAHSSMYLTHPEMFPQNSDASQLIDLIQTYQCETGHSTSLSEFIIETARCIIKTESEEGSLLEALRGSFETLKQRVIKMSLVDRNLFVHLEIFHYFLKSPELSSAVLKFCFPKDLSKARSYQDTLLGAFLGSSSLPRKSTDAYEFFDKSSRFSYQEHTITEQNLWAPMQNLSQQLEKCFYTILKQSSDTKELLLNWIGNCLNANSSRGKLWNNQMRNVFESQHCSDGFMINLCSVLLRLCKPFSEPFSPKLLKIQPTYCLKKNTKPGRLEALSKETCLVPSDEEERHIPEETFNFITEAFYCCHYALHVGFKTSHEHLTKLGQDLNRIQRVYEEARIQEGGQTSETIDHIQETMETGMTKFLSMKTALKEPEMLNNMLMFHLATATWLINAAITSDMSQFKKLTFPLDPNVPENLTFTPEFLVESIKDCVQFMCQFSPSTFEISYEFMQHLLSLIMVFMGSPERMKNPHLRANLAELLEALLPSKQNAKVVFSTDFYRKELFVSHPHIEELVPTLVHVFVSIEMTGQSVAFEQKFQYRRPMYAIFDYIRTVNLHLARIKSLAEYAEANIEAAQPPLFLRFINLLMNDAIFLLDEALSYMSQLKETQQEREAGAWRQLPPNQRLQNESNFQHIGMLARFHNVMGNDTIHTLQWLTANIQSIFCHPSLVDRITSMLNYFLLHLVGPKKKNFKVKDMDQYDFKPQGLVEDICQIYIHLGNKQAVTSRSFCAAVSQDGRSYSPELFKQAETVLYKIGKPQLATEVKCIASMVKKLADEISKDESTLGEAPEEFLDPIMNTLMTDPVRLPSSGMTVDRTTIARHLLSDQSDPFNRSPLSMDLIEPETSLKERIEDWVKQQKSKAL